MQILLVKQFYIVIHNLFLKLARVDDYYVRVQYQDTQQECEITSKVVDVKHEE